MGEQAHLTLPVENRNVSAEKRGDAIRHFGKFGGRDGERQFQSLWQECHIRSGMLVSVFDASLSHDFSFSYRKENRHIDFGFFLEGVFENDLKNTSVGRLNLTNRAGEGGVGFLHETRGTVTIPADRNIRVIHVHVLPEVLLAMLGEDLNVVQPQLRRVLEGSMEKDFFTRNSMSPLVQASANELFLRVRKNFGVRMYLEGKTLEMLALFLTQNGRLDSGAVGTLGSRERDIVHAIRDELEKHFAAPPTLAEISAKFGMGIPKIQAGFKNMFGMSVFGFVKEFKLQKARMLFEEGDMNVSEVAWAIGYINLSHFSTAYRKRFGVLPKAYLKSIRS